ncbi:biotin-dependent carboxyltransferase family protein [Paenibacillus soyae]|uniref:Biotin-dependent carboxyltransferase family protein n=1 Tax=Paenibacillus soyae TaxID=2969249 RepID=A0A9X2SAF6_9BACL|nr:biotin-dependent carboxyltransferase family protein [Paenibacillus soyae]MCR2804503.1 biotin-dependent carboxyltransferase family protein [Paenibacillus soyae]
MGIIVVKPGVLATIQDLGRYGYQNQGVVVGGSMDQTAARIANWLVGNDESEALLELTLAGTELRMEREAWIAIAGGDMEPITGQGEKVPQWRPVRVDAGTTIRFGRSVNGCRAYVALAGGIDGEMRLGSRSTYLRGGIGGYDGRALRAGDRIEARNEPAKFAVSRLAESQSGSLRFPLWHAGGFAVAHSDVAVIRWMPGAHYDWLSEEGQSAFGDGTFRIGRQSDRMGYRLEGEGRLGQHVRKGELLSEPVTIGTIQLPPDGNPIILMADRQTTGGYPRIGHVATVDLPVLAQLKPGDRLQLQRVTSMEAEKLLIEAEREMTMLGKAIELKLNG